MLRKPPPPTFFRGDFCHEFHRWTAWCQAWTAALSVGNLRKFFLVPKLRGKMRLVAHVSWKNSETMWINYNFHFQECYQTWNGLTFLFCEEWSSWVFCVWSWDWLDILCKGHDVEIMDGKLFGLNPWGCECHRWCGHPWVVSPYQRN